MRGALGNSQLLSIIITIIALLCAFFVSILAYSKAYKAKNRIIDVIEKYGTYEGNIEVESEIRMSLAEMGYQLGECGVDSFVINNEGYTLRSISNSSNYKYCIQKRENMNPETHEITSYYYEVTTYIEFYFPILSDFIHPAVTSETKLLGKKYDY